MSLALGEAGFNVAVHYHASKAEAEKVCEDIRKFNVETVAVQADLSKESDTEDLIAHASKAIGPLSLLVNSASVFENDDALTATRESWDRHIETNLRAPFVLAQTFARQIPEGNDNLIVNLIDQRVWKLTPQFMSYTVSKAALFTLTQTLAQAFGPIGIRVNAIGPGPTMRNARQSEADFACQSASTVLGRGAEPDDIVGALHYLIGAQAVTGQMIAVDGGQHLGWKTPDVLVNE